MLGESLLALAALAGQTVVDAATTDVWQTVEHRYAQLLGRGDTEQTHLVEQWLEETREQLAGRASGHPGSLGYRHAPKTRRAKAAPGEIPKAPRSASNNGGKNACLGGVAPPSLAGTLSA